MREGQLLADTLLNPVTRELREQRARVAEIERRDTPSEVTVNRVVGGGGGVSAHTLLDGGTAHSDAATGNPTKGDLVAGSGTAWDDFPVGGNGLLLCADSTQTLGLRYVSPVTKSWAHAMRV